MQDCLRPHLMCQAAGVVPAPSFTVLEVSVTFSFGVTGNAVHLADADGVPQEGAPRQGLVKGVRDVEPLAVGLRGHHLYRRPDRVPQQHLRGSRHTGVTLKP